MTKKITKTKEVKENHIFYVYASKDNKKMVDDIVKKYNEKISGVVNKIMDSYRLGKKPIFTNVVPEYVSRANKWKDSNK